jgi:serine/threonine protein phosphatase PrpC
VQTRLDRCGGLDSATPASAKAAIEETFRGLDSQVVAEATAQKWKDGTTATIVLVGNKNILAANVGDSRAVLVYPSRTERLTYDHTVADMQERKSIERLGGEVRKQGVWRVFVDGRGLAVSRGFGNAGFKSAKVVSCDPHVRQVSVDGAVAVVIASDGLWDCVSDEQAGEIVRKRNISEPAEATAAAQDLLKAANRDDNCTVIVLAL